MVCSVDLSGSCKSIVDVLLFVDCATIIRISFSIMLILLSS